MLAGTAFAFGVAWWLGLYLVARDPGQALLRRAGGGLLAYALALACGELAPLWPALGRVAALLAFLPALTWGGAILLLLPETPLRARLDRLWRLGLAPLSAAALIAAAATGLLASPAPLTPAYGVLSALVLLPLAGALILLVRASSAAQRSGAEGQPAARSQSQPAPLAAGLWPRAARSWPNTLLVVATLFFLLGTALLLFPMGWLPRPWALLGAGFDLVLLGVAVAASDAFEAGERLRPAMLRSLLAAAAAALLFGGQVALAIALIGATPALSALLLTTLAAAIGSQALADPLQALLDRLAFPAAPALQRARADLRAGAEALPRLDDGLDLSALDAVELARLTRRALSHMGDLPRLASSPLTRLPAVGARLAARGAPDQPLERAGELRALLAEQIARLKPREGGDFGTGDAWRHYNALYFPYVVGVRPYSRRADDAQLDPTARQAIAWLAAQVPERTLHNWQNAAAKLIAHSLSDQK